MKLKDLDLTLLKVEKREGISKQGKPYLFYTRRFIDQEGELLNLKFTNEVVSDPSLVLKLMAVKNVETTIDLNLYPS